MKQVKLNRAEVWIADHALPIFGAVALAIVAGAVAIFLVFLNQGAVESQVNVLKPQVTRVNKAICDKQSLDHSARAHRCAERIRVGLINCRRSSACRAAYLALATFPPPARDHTATSPATSSEPSSTAGDTGGGDAHQQPSNHGHQQPSPGEGQNPPAGAAPGASPGQEGEGAAEPSPGGNEGSGGQQGESGGSSGAGVEVCLLETCAGVEVEPGLKGLLNEPPIRRASTPPGTPEAAP